MFHFIASTGRTATTYLAAFLDALDGVAGCHESYRGSNKLSEPLLPAINLENGLCYRKPEAAQKVVGEKRNRAVISDALSVSDSDIVIDVAYYNAMIADALLETHADTKMVAVIRDCESFVRSATCTSGEDLLPVGWPDPGKALSEREKFIALGRIKPVRGTLQDQHWRDWSAIFRNIWLWQETNRRILEAASAHPDRSCVLAFSALKNGREEFLLNIIRFLQLPEPKDILQLARQCEEFRNRKSSGYQVGPSSEWSAPERNFLDQAQQEIDGLISHVRAH